ncbi:uncharacterized protein LOC144927077 [Branchiostoma floridae x Branchiostoma belcheri]
MSHEAPANTTRPGWTPRRRMAAAIFRGLWFGSNQTIGRESRGPGRDTPTYIFPEEIRWVMRARFPDDPVVFRDGEVEEREGVYRVDVVDLATTTWPRCRCEDGNRTRGRGRSRRRATPPYTARRQ